MDSNTPKKVLSLDANVHTNYPKILPWTALEPWVLGVRTIKCLKLIVYDPKIKTLSSKSRLKMNKIEWIIKRDFCYIDVGDRCWRRNVFVDVNDVNTINLMVAVHPILALTIRVGVQDKSKDTFPIHQNVDCFSPQEWETNMHS